MKIKFNVLTFTCLICIIFINNYFIVYGDNFIDKVKEQREKPIEYDLEDIDSDFSTNSQTEAEKSLLHQEQNFQKETHYIQNEIAITAKATAMKFLPITIAFSFILSLLSYFFESLSFLQRQAISMLFFSIIGLIIVFLAFPLVESFT